MKKLLRSALSLLVVLTIVLSFTITNFAEDTGVIFKGIDEGFQFITNSDYAENDLFGNFKDFMPGDVLTETINVKNLADDCDFIKVYIRAEAHDENDNPLSEGVANSGETVASMTDFLSKLHMTVWNGDKNGEPVYKASPDQLDGFAERVLLGEFRKGESTDMIVELEVPLGLATEYQNRTGEVDWIFSVEAFNDPVPPPTNNTMLTVRKVWVDDGENRPESITVNLLKNGKVHAETVLNADNQWTFTWDGLEDSAKWTVEETNVPEGYSVSYKIDGNITTIINTAEKLPDEPIIPDEPVKLTVKKTWSGDEDKIAERPTYVEATLYNGEKAVETVILNARNNWEYTWTDLSSEGDWSVVEVNIPDGYTPAYSTDGDVVTITNVAKLIQTGQMKWPVPVLAGIGVVMILFGGVMILKKRRSDNV